ncbi:MAG: sensor histidine kinase [Candidatus Methylomirabilia bacterium]
MRSLQARLVLVLVPLTVLVLVLTGLGIVRAVRRDLESGFDHRLLLLAQGISSALNVQIDGNIEFELDADDKAELRQSTQGAFFAVADERGAVLFSSDLPPSGLFGTGLPSPEYRNAAVRGRTMRICILAIARESGGDEEDRERWLESHPGGVLPRRETRSFLVAAGLSNEEQRATAVLLHRRLILGFGLLTILLAALPVLGVGLSLRPLQRIAREAEDVIPERPEARLTTEGVDREILPLVAALNRTLERLSAAFVEQKRFTADAAHEFRAPLSAIRAQCEVSLRKKRGVDELEEALSSIHRTTLRLGVIVESLLSLARLSAKGAELPMRSCDLASAAREAVRLLMPAAEAKGIEIRVELAEEIRIVGNDNLLAECFSNILDNAVRYTGRGGTVAVQGGTASRPWIAIADTGIGIPAEHLGRIFERFYQADPARSGKDGSSGLGLSIALEIARLHAGSIKAESSPGAGSRFTLVFGIPFDPGETG